VDFIHGCSAQWDLNPATGAAVFTKLCFVRSAPPRGVPKVRPTSPQGDLRLPL
jgi:hypothetical protein